MTVFHPYHASKDSKLNMEMNKLGGQLRDHGKTRAVNKKNKIKRYIQEKITSFIDGSALSGEGSLDLSANLDGSPRNGDNEDNLKVLIFTIALSDRLNDVPGAWDELKEGIILNLNGLKSHPDYENIVVCLNVHNDS